MRGDVRGGMLCDEPGMGKTITVGIGPGPARVVGVLEGTNAPELHSDRWVSAGEGCISDDCIGDDRIWHATTLMGGVRIR